MSVFDLRATGIGATRLAAVVDLAMERNGPASTIYGWSSTPEAVILHSYKGSLENIHPFIAPIDAEGAAKMLIGWISDPKAQWSREPDTDGDCEKGWLSSNQNCSHSQILEIRRHWIVYGK